MSSKIIERVHDVLWFSLYCYHHPMKAIIEDAKNLDIPIPENSSSDPIRYCSFLNPISLFDRKFPYHVVRLMIEQHLTRVISERMSHNQHVPKQEVVLCLQLLGAEPVLIKGGIP